MEFRSECWHVTPLEPPRLLRHCTRCGDVRPFVCAETFRVNAQKKIIDVWLNYRCNRCAELWKCPVLERQPISNVAPDRLQAYFHDDPIIARHCAFDTARLARHAGRIHLSSEVQVRRVAISSGEPAPAHVRLTVPLPCAVRLDGLLAKELDMSRAAVYALYDSGRLRILPVRRNALAARIHDGQQLWLNAPS